MQILNKEISKAVERPVRAIQFGEGNFLRGFVDYMIDISNEKGLFQGNVVIVQPIDMGNLNSFAEQECQYTLSLRGKDNGETKVENRIITCIADAVSSYKEYEKYAEYSKLETLRFVFSNTTEAGIAFDETDLFESTPPKTYPGKLTKFLYERYRHFNGASDKGLIVIPCELIDNNGIVLKEYILKFSNLWGLEEDFENWIHESCVFCSTLVDRIITGYPKDEVDELCRQFGYVDKLLDTGEIFGLWVIESPKDISGELPFDKAGLPVIFTDNQKPYKERKVRILNGAHTSFVLASYLAGNDYVLESMQDSDVRKFTMDTVFNEIIPTLTLPKEELITFANSVIERFENPFIKHALLSISLNSVSKWKTRCLPSFKEYVNLFGKLPVHLTFSLTALMSFYRSEQWDDKCLIGHRGEETYKIMDDQYILEFFASAAALSNDEFVKRFLSTDKFFGEDMTKYSGLQELVIEYMDLIDRAGMREAIKLINQ